MSYSAVPTAARPTRAHEWTVDKQRGFLEALAHHGRVTEAADGVGMSAASAYRLRAREAAFAFGWRAAAAFAYERLRELALDRATNGVVTPRLYHGAVVSETVRYSDRLLLGLLAHLKPEASVDPKTGRRGAALVAAELWAAAVDAYDTASETGEAPVAPRTAHDDDRRPAMTREQFIAAIEARVQPEVDADGGEPRPQILWGPGTQPAGATAPVPYPLPEP